MVSLYLEPVPPGRNRLSRQRLGKILLVGVCATAVVLPIVTYTYLTFGSTPVETTTEARRILINYRIPHHIKPEVWFDGTAVVKLILLPSAAWITRKSRLFIVLVIPAITGLVLGLLYVATRNDFLGLIFPWRMSTFLVPISSAIVIDWFIHYILQLRWFRSRRVQKWLFVLAYTMAGMALIVGLTRQVLDFQRHRAARNRRYLLSSKNIYNPARLFSPQ